jgi:polysaccharide deacetylase family protein (PEP-CTERM system associated)
LPHSFAPAERASRNRIGLTVVLNAFTVDLEEWFHICGVEALAPATWDALPSRVELTTRSLLDLLDETGTRATFFTLGWVAERYPHLIAEIASAGHDIGSHGYWHRRAYEMSEPGFIEDVQASRAALSNAGVHHISAFRAPEWSINDRTPWALEVLVRQAFTLDASMAPVRIVGDVRYSRRPFVQVTPAGPILEAPPLVCDRFGQVMPIGWGWGLRMSSPRRVLREIARANQLGWPVVLTVHPWELDPAPPNVFLPARLRFAHYFRLSGFARRLRTILKGASFGPLEASVGHLRSG